MDTYWPSIAIIIVFVLVVLWKVLTPVDIKQVIHDEAEDFFKIHEDYPNDIEDIILDELARQLVERGLVGKLNRKLLEDQTLRKL